MFHLTTLSSSDAGKSPWFYE